MPFMSGVPDVQVTTPKRSLTLVAASFIVFGTFWGAWVVAAADVEREFGFSHATLGLLLSLSLVGASLTNVVGGALTERRGTARVLSGTLFVWGALVFVAMLANSAIAFGVLLVGIITSGGLLDV